MNEDYTDQPARAIEPTAEVYEQAANAWAMDVNSKMTVPFPPDAEPLSLLTAHRVEASSFRAAADVAFAAGAAAGQANERAAIVAMLRAEAEDAKKSRYWDFVDAYQRSAALIERSAS